MPTWQLQEAKARFSELMRGTVTDRRRSPFTADVQPSSLSAEDYDRLKRSKPSLREFLRMSPLAGIRLNIECDKPPACNVEL